MGIGTEAIRAFQQFCNLILLNGLSETNYKNGRRVAGDVNHQTPRKIGCVSAVSRDSGCVWFERVLKPQKSGDNAQLPGVNLVA